jgi:hypothetical protein
MVVAAAGAIPLLVWYGRGQWFFLDEWDFLVNRSAKSVHDLFAPYNGHWSTVPILAYRLNFQLWGIRTYLPYQLPVILLHVALTLALWLLMRHLKVRPWIATGVAIPYLVFGSGLENIIFAFQIGFTGAALCGVMQLVLADHDGSIERRDWLGLAFGVVGLMCASGAVALGATVGVAVLLRRGWRVAAFHVGPLAVAFIVWFAVIGHTSKQPTQYDAKTVRFALELVRNTFMGLGEFAAAAVLVAVLAVVGVVAGLAPAVRDRRWRTAAVPTGLLVGFVCFLVLTSVARSGLGVGSAESSRYLHMAAVFVLPLVALGGETLARRREYLAVVPIVLLAIGVPRNANAFEQRSVFARGREDIIAVAPHSRFFDSAPAKRRYGVIALVPTLAPTAQWLRAAKSAGRLPGIAHPSAQLVLEADGIFALDQQVRGDVGECVERSGEFRVHLERGQGVRFDSPVDIYVVRGASSSGAFRFDPAAGRKVFVVAGPIDLKVIAGDSPARPVCVPPGAIR